MLSGYLLLSVCIYVINSFLYINSNSNAPQQICGNQIVPGDGIGRGCPTDCPVKWGEDQQLVFFQGCSG